MLNSNELKKVYVMLRCTKGKHPNCIPVRNAAMKSSKRILQAHTTNMKFEGTEYCVTAKALVPKKELKDFVAGLRKIKTASRYPTTIAKVDVLIGE